MRTGTIVKVVPSDTDDPLAVEWTGRRCRVVSPCHGSILSHWRVEDVENFRKATFREQDLMDVTEEKQ